MFAMSAIIEAMLTIKSVNRVFGRFLFITELVILYGSVSLFDSLAILLNKLAELLAK